MEKLTHKELLLDFIQFEAHNKLLDWEINKIPIWQLIRISIFNKLKSELIGESFEITDKNAKKIIVGFKEFLKNTITKNPFVINEEKETIILNHSRRKRNGNIYEDIYTDYFIKKSQLTNFIVLERFYNLSHIKPTSTNNLFYLDVLEYPTRFICRFPISIDLTQVIRINKLILEKWGIKNVIEPKLIKRYIRYFQFTAPKIDLLLNRIKPKLIIEVVSYSLMNQIFTIVAKKHSIPVIELQHGTVGPYHIAYNYIGKLILKSFPDYFFSWGDFWTLNAKLPITEENIKPVGFPYIDHFRETDIGIIKNQKQVLVISQLRKDIAEFTFKLASLLPDYKFVFKAHPREYSIAKDRYQHLGKTGNIEIVDHDNKPIYNLFQESNFTLGVSSTALIEALAFGCKVGIIKLFGWEYYEDVEEDSYFKFLSNVEEGRSMIIEEEISKTQNDENVFFVPDAIQNIQASINKIIAR